jgi:hypothetical protein
MEIIGLLPHTIADLTASEHIQLAFLDEGLQVSLRIFEAS